MYRADLRADTRAEAGVGTRADVRNGRDRGAEAAVRDADPVAIARSIVLRQLTMAPRSRGELQAALAKRSVPEEAAREVLDRMEEVGLVDDGAFAQAWVRSRRSTRGLSRRALAHELRGKSIDDDLAQEALQTVGDDDEYETAVALVRRRLPSTRGLEHAARVRRLAGMLARKGYSGGMAFAAVRRALDEDAGRDDPLDDEAPDDLVVPAVPVGDGEDREDRVGGDEAF